MKPTKIILTLFLACSINFLFSQHNSVSINGLKIGETYTQAQILAALGEQTLIQPPQPTDERANLYTYKVNNNRFVFVDNQFHSLILNDNTCAVNNFLRVGDNISKINQLGGIKSVEAPYKENGAIIWRPSKEGIFEITYLTVIYPLQSGIIKVISCSINDL